MKNHLTQSYVPFDISFSSGKGTTLVSSEGKEYLDLMSGVGTVNLGHGHSAVVETLKRQGEQLWHVSNWYKIPQQQELAKLLCENSFADQVFFCNSGAEAVESGIKLARKYTKDNFNDEKNEIITLKRGFHGRTFGALTATAQPEKQKPFEPLIPGFKYIEPNDESAAKATIGEKTAAVLAEPIQGEGGVHPLDQNYLELLRALCDEHNALLMFDEVQCGMGRTGTLFAYEQYGVEPDVMLLAKGLGNGFPIGAMLATEKYGKAFTPGSHGSTFGGNPLACNVAKAVVQEMLKPGFLDEVITKGKFFMEQLKQLQQEFPEKIKEVRGKGFMIGVELMGESKPVVEAFLKEGMLANIVTANTVRFLPPLVISEEELGKVVEVFDKILKTG